MTYRVADVAALLADVREHSRKALAERLLAVAHQDVRNQLVAPVRQFTKDLNEAQLLMWHQLLDHQEPKP